MPARQCAEMAKAIKYYAQGLSVPAAARKAKVSDSALYKSLKKQGLIRSGIDRGQESEK